MHHNIKRMLVASVTLGALLGGLATPAAAASTTKATFTLEARTANLGDSYSSGEGGTEARPRPELPAYLPGSDTPTDQCHRSQTSPAELLDLTPLEKVMTDVACSGATTTDIVSTSRYGEPPQATKLDSTIQRTHIMISGNDIGFGPVSGCIIQLNCEQTAAPDQVRAAIMLLGPKLDAAYAAIKQRAPNATHMVALYPPLFPPNGTADLSRCPYLNQSEVAIGNELTTKLNAVITQRALAHGFKVAKTAAGYVGHSVCSAQPYFYLPGPNVPQAAWFHPNLNGRAVIAAAYVLAA